MDMTPDGSALFVIGNFTSIGTATRHQIAKLDLGDTSASVASWSTNFYSAECASVFDTYMRDLDVSPDGSYVVVTTTGAYRGSTSPCDTAARFEIGPTGSGQVASWVAYTGGDTTYAVAVTGTAVYLGGHFRWWNNPFAGDSAGPGAVPREGLAALDPRSGIPLTWNPGRDRGVGVFDFLATGQGLWFGSDTDTVYNETHRKIAFFPLAGGRTLPVESLGTLPNDVYLVGSTANSLNTIRRQYFDASNPPSNPATLTGPESWSSARGAMLIDDQLYTAWSNGTLTRRTFDGSSFGTPSTVNLYNGSFAADAANVSGMFFDKADGRIYYTMSTSNSLFWRGFSPESSVVGAARFTATGTISTLNPNRVAGMFLDGDRLYFADRTNADLYSIGFTRGVVSGTPVLEDTTIDWRARGTFIWNGTPAPVPNVDPTAEIDAPVCTDLACTFDATGSIDPDGVISTYTWDFGDGDDGTGPTPQHTFPATGTYQVTLTVTDNRGGTDTNTLNITVARPAIEEAPAVEAELAGPISATPVAPPPDSDGDGVADAQDSCPIGYGVAAHGGCPPPPSASVRAVAKNARSKLFVDVDPNAGKGFWRFQVQRKQPDGSWRTLKTYRTTGSRETRTVNLKRGTYRVWVNPKYGRVGALSVEVYLTR